MPKISVIVPVYKAELFIRECLDSIKRQSFANWECLLIDDGSPDKSGNICDEYALVDPRFKVFHVNNGGVSRARNIGLNNMLGEWIMFVDSDDSIAMNTFDICLKYAQEEKLDLLQFSIVRKKNSLCKHDGVKTEVLDLESFVDAGKLLVCAGGSFFRASVIRNNNLLFSPQLKLAEDQLFMFNFMNNAKRFKRIDDCLYWYRENLCSATFSQKTNDMACSIKKLVEFKRSNHIWSAYIDRVNAGFLIRVILNNDMKLASLKELVRSAKIDNFKMIDFGMAYLFCIACQINYTFAIMLVKVRYAILKYIHIG